MSCQPSVILLAVVVALSATVAHAAPKAGELEAAKAAADEAGAKPSQGSHKKRRAAKTPKPSTKNNKSDEGSAGRESAQEPLEALGPVLSDADDPQTGEGAPIAAQSPPATSAATPLALREPAPLKLRDEPETGGWWYKLLLVLGAAAAGAWVYWRRKHPPKAPPAPAMQVVARTRLGARSELLIVDVGGRQLLLGVTPSSIRCLEQLEEAEDEEEQELHDGANEPHPVDFSRALGEVERRLARYEQTQSQPARASRRSPRASRGADGNGEQPASIHPGGEQARTLLRLAHNRTCASD